ADLYSQLCVQACDINGPLVDRIRFACYYYRTERGNISRKMMLRDQKKHAYETLHKDYNGAVKTLLGDSLKQQFDRRIFQERAIYNGFLGSYTELKTQIDSCQKIKKVQYEYVKKRLYNYPTYSFDKEIGPDSLEYIEWYMKNEFRDKCLYVYDDKNEIPQKAFIYCQILSTTRNVLPMQVDKIQIQFINYRTQMCHLRAMKNKRTQMHILNLSYHKELYRQLGEEIYEDFMINLYQNQLYYKYITNMYTVISEMNDEELYDN
ncbi:hypothetical protein OAT16_09545, partial [Prolixibacteraceae bacterium]|nr:hypothetical protein [Prolixibacteraceae bacterium]